MVATLSSNISGRYRLFFVVVLIDPLFLDDGPSIISYIHVLKQCRLFFLDKLFYPSHSYVSAMTTTTCHGDECFEKNVFISLTKKKAITTFL